MFILNLITFIIIDILIYVLFKNIFQLSFLPKYSSEFGISNITFKDI